LKFSTPKIGGQYNTYNHNRAQNADNAFGSDLGTEKPYVESLGMAHCFSFQLPLLDSSSGGLIETH